MHIVVALAVGFNNQQNSIQSARETTTAQEAGQNMMRETGWMKNVVLLAGVCVSSFATGCAIEPASDQELNPAIGPVQPHTVAGTWVDPPGNGVMTGFGGGLGPLVVCRSPADGGQQPGKLWEAACNYGFGGQEQRSTTYQVLLNGPFQWVLAPNALPQNAVDGGDAGVTAHDVRLGVCQVFRTQDSTYHPGKFYAGKCNIAWGGKELAVSPDGSNVYLLVQ